MKPTASSAASSPAALPSPADVAAHRVNQLRERIAAGDYAIDPLLIAQAILATQDPATPTRTGVNFLTLHPVTVTEC